jgi:hypothetical protein
VSAHVSPRDRNPAFLPVIAARVFNRSRVDRASRSSRVTVTTSPSLKLVEQPAKLRSVGLCAARHFAEHFFASGLGELAHLCIDALAVRRYPRIAVFHRPVVARSVHAESASSSLGTVSGPRAPQ